MKLSVIGLGVGYSLSVSLASIGIKTVGLDINPGVVSNPRYDAGIARLLKSKSKIIKKNLHLTTSYNEIESSDIVLMVVNTDYKKHTLDIKHLLSAIKDILKQNTGTLAVLSTLPYGASKEITQLIDNKIGYVYVPMMVAQGNLLETFINPAFLAFGAYEKKYSKEIEKFYKFWLKKMNGNTSQTFLVNPEEAELAKLVSNAFTSTKMTFANLCGELFEKLGINGERVMEVVSTNPTIGSRFFRPGYAFGGQCFPRDLDTVITLMKKNQIQPSILEGVQHYNLLRTYNPLQIYPKIKQEETLILGLVYKSGIMDTRFSPSLELYNELKKNNSKVFAFDANLDEFKKIHNFGQIKNIIIATNEKENKFIIKQFYNKNVTILDYANMITKNIDKKWNVFQAGKGWVKK